MQKSNSNPSKPTRITKAFALSVFIILSFTWNALSQTRPQAVVPGSSGVPINGSVTTPKLTYVPSDVQTEGDCFKIGTPTALFKTADCFSINGLTLEVQSLVTGIAGTDFNISSVGSTHTFNIPISSTFNTGKLSNFDFVRFDNLAKLTTKGDILTFDVLPNRLPVGANTQILTADDTTTTGVKWTALQLTPGFVFIGNPSNVATGVQLVGDVTVSIDGVTTIGLAAVNLTTDVAGILPVPKGGTGVATLSPNGVLLGAGTGPITAAALTNGQILIGSTNFAPVAATLTGTANQVIVTNGDGTITLSLPQPIAPTSSPTFLGATLTDLAVGGTLGVTGTSTLTGNTTVGGTLRVTGATTLSSTLTLSPITAGSVLFASTGGTLTQDNPGFNYNDTFNTLGLGAAATEARLTLANNIATGFLDTYSEYQQILNNGGTALTSYGFGVKSGSMVFNSGAGGYSFDRAGNVTAMSIDVNGNVIVGPPSSGSTFHLKGNAGILNLEGTDHAYIQLFPDGLAAGRKGFIGYGSGSDNDFTMANEIPGAGISFSTFSVGGSLTKRMLIASDGRVTPGVTGQKLGSRTKGWRLNAAEIEMLDGSMILEACLVKGMDDRDGILLIDSDWVVIQDWTRPRKKPMTEGCIMRRETLEVLYEVKF